MAKPSQATRQSRNQLDAVLRSAFGEKKVIRVETLKSIWSKIEKVVNLDRLTYFLKLNKKKLSSCCKDWIATKIGQLEKQFFVAQHKIAWKAVIQISTTHKLSVG